MKRILLFTSLLLLFCFVNSFGQKLLISNSKLIKNPVADVTFIDSLYPNAFHFDSSVYSVFPGKGEEVGKAWVTFHKDMGKYLSENNYKWNVPGKAFCKVFFHKTGEIDYIYFKFKEIEKQEDFQSLINEFIKSYKFQLFSEESKFSQCGVVVFKDKE